MNYHDGGAGGARVFAYFILPAMVIFLIMGLVKGCNWILTARNQRAREAVPTSVISGKNVHQPTPSPHLAEPAEQPEAAAVSTGVEITREWGDEKKPEPPAKAEPSIDRTWSTSAKDSAEPQEEPNQGGQAP